MKFVYFVLFVYFMNIMSYYVNIIIISSSSVLCRVFILMLLRQTYVPEEYSVAAILLLLFTVHIPSVSVFNLLYLYISTFGSVGPVAQSV